MIRRGVAHDTRTKTLRSHERRHRASRDERTEPRADAARDARNATWHSRNRAERRLRSNENAAQAIRGPGRSLLPFGPHEVTRAEYAAFLNATGRADPVGCRVFNAAGGRGNDPRASWRAPGFVQHDDRHPVVCVSWADARAYAAWLSGQAGAPYRLPSEAEWEYAARSGTTTRHYWGDRATAQCTHANGADRAAAVRFADWAGAGCDDGVSYTAPAGSYAANGFGIHDMLGNVAEWVADCWRSSYAGMLSRDGTSRGSGEPCALRVLRGGSGTSPPDDLRSAFRESNYANIRSHAIGFRVARTIERP